MFLLHEISIHFSLLFRLNGDKLKRSEFCLRFQVKEIHLIMETETQFLVLFYLDTRQIS